MSLKIIKNLNEEVYVKVAKNVKDNNGFCPCSIIQDQDTKCMCKEFREKTNIGLCHCELYEKVEL